MNPAPSIPIFDSPTVTAAWAFVTRLHTERQDARLVFHHARLGELICTEVTTILKANAAGESVIETAQLAALFFGVGFLFDYRRPETHSTGTARQFLREQGFNPQRVEEVVAAIQTLAGSQAPASLAEQALADAYHIVAFLREPGERSPLLRLERELILGQTLPKPEWARHYLQLLLGITLYTPQARQQYAATLSKAMLSQRKIIEKAENVSPEYKTPVRPFQYLDDDQPLRGVQTFFRTNYRIHINLSAIADNKANIMISVNSILISVLITALSYRNMAQTHPTVLLPVVIFLVTGLASLIFAVLSARPKVTMLNKNLTDKVQMRRNIAFFGNFVTLKLEEFEEMLDDVFRDGELLYGNMARDLYYLGKVLDKKYRYLTISYNIFMLGFIATVITFLFTLFR